MNSQLKSPAQYRSPKTLILEVGWENNFELGGNSCIRINSLFVIHCDHLCWKHLKVKWRGLIQPLACTAIAAIVWSTVSITTEAGQNFPSTVILASLSRCSSASISIPCYSCVLDNVTGKCCLISVDNCFWIVEAFSRLSQNGIITNWGVMDVSHFPLGFVLPSKSNFADNQESNSCWCLGFLIVVMSFGGIRSKIDSSAKSIPRNVGLGQGYFKPSLGDSTHRTGIAETTGEIAAFCSMK